jgi:hypothetical protein
MLTAASSVSATPTGISSILTTTTTGTATTTNGVTFDNDTMALNEFYNGTNKYVVDSSVNITNEYSYIRRNTGDGDPNQSSMWYANSNATTMLANSSTSMSDATGTPGQTTLLANNFYAGADNLFANSGATAPTLDNVERADFIFGATAIQTTAQMAFAVFDRGSAGSHDPFAIAAITGFNSATGQVTAFGGTLLYVTTTEYGSVNPTDNGNPASTFNYSLFRYSNGDTLGSPSYWASDTETGNQGIGGVMITPSDMGLANGTTIYGYALMGSDVTDNGTVSNLVNWNNATFYPTNTSSATGGAGGLDPAAVNGVLFKMYVPEPSTYGAIFTGLAISVALLRKHRAKVKSRRA